MMPPICPLLPIKSTVLWGSGRRNTSFAASVATETEVLERIVSVFTRLAHASAA